MIRYIKGNALEPTERPAVIMHICNNIGAWGRGFVKAISEKWELPEQAYREMEYKVLGEVQAVGVESGIWVCNMIAQNGVKNRNNPRPISYEALARCTYKVAVFAKEIGATVHAPKIGTGLAGGNWDVIKVILENGIGRECDVTIYEL